MKKNAIIALAILLSLPLSAKDPFRHKASISLYTGSQTKTETAVNKSASSNMNFGLEVNFAQIKLHKNIIGDMLCVRLDLGLDLTYSRYDKIKTELNTKHEEIDWYPQQAEAGLNIGPSLHFAPIRNYQDLQLMAYYHFIPCASAHIEDTNVYGAFNPFMSYGFGVNWKFIGIGFEHRWGSADYKTYDIEYQGQEYNTGNKAEFKTTSDRFFLRFNF